MSSEKFWPQQEAFLYAVAALLRNHGDGKYHVAAMNDGIIRMVVHMLGNDISRPVVVAAAFFIAEVACEPTGKLANCLVEEGAVALLFASLSNSSFEEHLSLMCCRALGCIASNTTSQAQFVSCNGIAVLVDA